MYNIFHYSNFVFQMLHWSINQIKLDLKYTWKISRNATIYKINSIITCSDEKYKGQGEVAPNIRYNETPELILNSFEQFVNSGANQIKNASELSVILNLINAHYYFSFSIFSLTITNKNSFDQN